MRSTAPSFARTGGGLVGTVVLIGASLIPGVADAIPAFARKYETSCTTCHARAYPELNPFGRFFKENGYQLVEGAEAGYRGSIGTTPGASGERLLLWRDLPFAARVQSNVRVPTAPKAASANALDFRMLKNVFVLLGGAVARDVSVFVAASLEPNAALHHGAVGFHNLIFGDGALNLRAGQLLLMDFARPEHRSMTRVGNVGAVARVGLNPTGLDTNHLGVQLYGRVWDRRLFYSAALVQGAQGADGVTDLDGNKDGFGHVQLTVRERHTLGAFAYRGRTFITDSARAVVVRFTDRFTVVGSDAEIQVGPMTLFGYGLYGRHENPNGLGVSADYWGVRGELDIGLTRAALAILRYDRVLSSDAPEIERELLTAHATYLLLTNLKLGGEYVADVADFDQSTVYLMLDLAM